MTGVDLDFDGDVGVAGKGARDLPPGKHAFPFSFNLPTHSRKGQPLAGSFKYKDGHAGWSGDGLGLGFVRMPSHVRPGAIRRDS